MLSFQSALLASRRARRGVAMLEILFALSIIAFLGLGALYLYNQATTGNRNRTAISQVQNVQQSVRTLYAGQSDYGAGGTDFTNIVAASKTLPGNMINSGGVTLKHVFGGSLTVTANAAGTAWKGLTPPGPAFIIQMNSVPAESCSSMVTADNGGASSGLVGVATGTNQAVAPPLTPAAVSTASGLCPPTATGPTTVYFMYQ